MRAVWASRQEELLHDCLVSPHVFAYMVDRLRDFAVPYQHCLETEADKRNVYLYLAGLLSHLPRKNAEEIAALVDVERLVMQAFIGTAPWDHRPLVKVLVGQVVEAVGRTRWGDRLRSQQLPEAGHAFGGSETAMVWPPRQGRQLSGWGLHGVCVSRRSCLARLPVVPARGLGAGHTQAPSLPCARRHAIPHSA